MARYLFTPGKEYAGRVHAIWKKSLVNTRLDLVRLEFEVFQILDDIKLASTGKIACRDIVVGRGVDMGADAGVAPFVLALHISNPCVISNWLDLHRRKKWVKIIFGRMERREHRNVFQRIFPLDNFQRYQIIEYDYDLDAEWVKVAEAADDLECSAATVRRRTDRLEPEFGAKLVRRTKGGHRRINLHLLRNLE